MSNYTYFVSDDQVSLINISNGNRVTIHKDDPRFDNFKTLIIDGKYSAAENLDVKTTVSSFAVGAVSIVDGVGTIKLGASSYPLPDVIVKRIIKMVDGGFDSTPLLKFLTNLYENPAKSAVDELFLFLDQTELPITEDGHFIAYKIVRNDYKDIYSGTFDHSIGKVVSMPRFAVDDNRSNTCSAGLHFCSRTYLAHYGSGHRDKDRCVLVKINPADVVSIPVDYNNAKGRTCKYEVVGEMKDSEWRDMLSKVEYTTSAVVDECGNDFDDYIEDEDDVIEDKLRADGFYFDPDMERFRECGSNRLVSRIHVANVTGIDIEELLDYAESYDAS